MAAGSVEVLAVVPARYASTRFPAKIIAPLDGKPLVLHAFERARRAALVSDVIIATDDQRVVDAVRPWTDKVVLTRADHATGTDRIAEVAGASEAQVIVNVQGDEALIDPNTIDATIRPVLDRPDVVMSTARHPLTAPEHINDPNIVKVVCDAQGLALYFSRCPIPYVRDAADYAAAAEGHWQHIGLYVYRRDFLLEFARMPQTPLEKLEKLEQLRVLENGYKIAVVDTDYRAIGVDVPEDLERVRAILKARKEG